MQSDEYTCVYRALLSFVLFAGPLPANLAKAPGLFYLSVSNNSLIGGLEPFATALAANNDTSRLFGLDASNNRLTGPIPNGLEKLGMLNPDFTIDAARG